MNKKVILMILDGWGKSPDPKVSAIDNADIPFINSLYKNYPSAQLRTDGLNVGLPEGQMGNSEVGHMNLGAGRIVYQDLAKINLAVEHKTLHQEKVLHDAFEYAKKNNKNVHFLGQKILIFKQLNLTFFKLMTFSFKKKLSITNNFKSGEIFK